MTIPFNLLGLEQLKVHSISIRRLENQELFSHIVQLDKKVPWLVKASFPFLPKDCKVMIVLKPKKTIHIFKIVGGSVVAKILHPDWERGMTAIHNLFHKNVYFDLHLDEILRHVVLDEELKVGLPTLDVKE